MKQFIEAALPRDGECFRHLCSKFTKLPEAELRKIIFTGPDIRKLLSDLLFSDTIGRKVEKEAWDTFKDVVHMFWANAKHPTYLNRAP